MLYLQFTFQISDQVEKECLLAQLSEISFDGFEETESELLAYISEDLFDEKLFKSIVNINNVIYSKSIVKEKNWNEIWESDFQPISVMHPANKEVLFAFIRASFHQPNPAALFDISITPKMSFGTGHHATTFQMIQAMSVIDFTNKSVIDFGTGTGVLAILAEQLGATYILAIDNDDWSIENAIENCSINHSKHIVVTKETSCNVHDFKADIILANINLNVIIDNLEYIKQAGKKDTVILFSGILTSDQSNITDKIEQSGLHIEMVDSLNNWLIIRTRV